ncbi:type IIL restriction-modification enzyme MmeI [uncultured Enterovirga sp.]|uniref:type IIL restriction-modification enzyme MmeI n=1 Tax=uncultured Enterovirga sp. TaxID=2026352 RepID=UPI0035CBDF5D
MRLSWNEIRARAAGFADEWRTAHYEKGQTQTFYNELFEVFGVKRRRVASFEEPVKLLGTRRGFIDLFWKGVLLVEHKSAGRSLAPAKAQALDYFPGLKEVELPRYILLSDFQNFELYDLDEGTEVRFSLAELPRHVEAFGFIVGVQKRTFRDQDPVNIKASELMGRLHDSLKASGYDGHDLERFLVRLLFCLFADDTGIFERDIFESLIQDRTRPDGSDVGPWLSNLFEVLNTPEKRRQTKLDADLNQFPYVNGDLFAERLPIPSFDGDMRSRLLEACEFSWDAISPAIFGSLFQSVMNAVERRRHGAHYTTERNILKVIEPLFLDELRAEFARLRTRRDTGRGNALRAFQDKMAGLRLFDPACGCGNFLIIAYRELRSLETEVLRELHPDRRQRVLKALSAAAVKRRVGRAALAGVQP